MRAYAAAVLSYLLIAFTLLPPALAADLHSTYTLALLEDRGVSVTHESGKAVVFKPEFTVLFRADDPRIGRKRLADCNYEVPSWRLPAKPEQATPDYFQAARLIVVSATDARSDNGVITWEFADQPEFTLKAQVSPGEGNSEPGVIFEIHAKQAGWYSVGFTGAPALDPAKADEIWQPLVWQEKRFPAVSAISTEFMSCLPATLVTAGGTTYGVIADPAEIPYRMPTPHNGRVGVVLRNRSGEAQPMLFAPVLGLPESKLAAGLSFKFNLRLVARAGRWFETLEQLAHGLYGFRDLRENTTCSLNQTIENMIALDIEANKAGWDPDGKAYDYTTDVKDTVKLVSALHPLSLAVITDNEELFRQRALPMIEFLLSREKFLFAKKAGVKGQAASHRMAGPGGEVSEWSSLLGFSKYRTTLFRHLAEQLHDRPRALNLSVVRSDARWVDDLALYQATGDHRHLDAARAGADAYIAQRINVPASDFKGAYIPGDGQFWTDFAPRWMELLELHKVTGDRRYLDAAVRGAQLYAGFAWFYPPIPDGEITVNLGGTVIGGRGPFAAPERKVPAWQVAPWGLVPEASTTYIWNPAVFLAHHAPYMLRLARQANEPFFREIARNAVVGRYANYPGYDINNTFTDAYAQADYPLAPGHPYERYNQLYFNHIWPHIALLTDYLISDAMVQSDGRISFPSRYAQGYVYLQCRVYGDQPGTFYGDKDVQLYMPAGLIKTDNVQINYVAGRGNGQLYVALMNQSKRAQNVTLTFEPVHAGIDPKRSYNARVWRDNQASDPVTIANGQLTIPISPSGISAIAIEGVQIAAPLQARLFDEKTRPLSDKSWSSLDTPFGIVHAMLMSFGADLTSGYVWLTADETVLDRAVLHWRANAGEWHEVTKSAFPYEFSFAVPDNAREIELWVEGAKGGQTLRSSITNLTR